MTAVVYVGSSLPLARAREVAPELQYRAPVRQGDVYRAVRAGARVIGIIDGELDQALPVWHKELLWAIAAGARVFGAASMGALRAVELEPFGMIGIGRVYAWFRDGTLEDDDEVVVAHATSEHGHRPLSSALVNLRATLEVAQERGVLEADVARELIRRAKALHYSERSFAALRRLSEAELGARCQRFWRELPGLVIDVKAADAELLLQRLSQELHEPRRGGEAPPFELTPTSAWQAFVEHHETEPEHVAPEEALPLARAYQRALALELARAAGIEVEAREVQAVSEAFRRARGLGDPEVTRAWLARQGLSLEQFSLLMRDEALVRRLASAAASRGQAQLPILAWLEQRQGGHDGR